VSTDDPFESYRWKREIGRMESEFRENASVRRRRLDDLAQGEDDTVEFERKVAIEMRDFLQDSASAAERILGEIVDSGEGANPAEVELRHKLEALIAGASPPTGEVDLSEPPDTGDETSGTIRRRALARKYGARPVDLRAALARIRHHAGAPPEEPSCSGRPPKPANRNEILATFDETCCQVAHLLGPASAEEPVAVVDPLPEPPAAVLPPPDELRLLRDEVRRLRGVVELLVKKGIIAESDLA
jgi:hypothetical protein